MALVAFVLALGLTAAAPPESPTIVFGRDVEIVADRITLGDVADLSALPAPLRLKAEMLVLARFPAGSGDATFSARRLSERSRALMPALAPWLPAADGTVISVRRLAAESTPAADVCLRAMVPIVAGDYPAATAFTSAECGARPARPAFQYDRKTGLVRAARDLAADEIVPAPPASTLAAVGPGRPLYLTATIGAVAVQREVVAIRAAGDGEPVVVRAKDGTVFTAPMSEFTQ